MRRILVLVLAVLALTACTKQAPEVSINDQVPADQRTEAGAAAEGGSEAAGGGGGGGDATWVAVDIDFESAPDTLPAGEQTITLQNNGASVHNVTIDGEVIVEAQGGESAEGSVNLDAGEHEYVCSIPGHEQLMMGTLTVE